MIKLASSALSGGASSANIGSRRKEEEVKLPKFVVAQEDLDRIQAAKDVVAKTKDFNGRAKQLRIQSSPDVPTDIVHFLNALSSVMQSDQLSKHKTEKESVDRITRLIKGTGEQCRDFLQYFSNLRHHNAECLGQLDHLS